MGFVLAEDAIEDPSSPFHPYFIRRAGLEQAQM